jgi:hypothetical protein
MDVVIHVEAIGRDPSERFVATRCYPVEGVIHDTVLLVAVDDAIDADGDGFPADPADACRDPGDPPATPAACDFACPR